MSGRFVAATMITPSLPEKTIHFDEQLVERLLAFVVATADACAALASDGVDLVDEDEAGRGLLGLLEKIAHAACAHAHEHFDERCARHREEGHARFSGDGLGQERLACARRAHQEHAAGNLAAQAIEAALDP